MVKVREYRLRSGTGRWDVIYKDEHRLRHVPFTDPAEAAEYAHLVNLRGRRLWPLAPLLERSGLTPRQLADALGLGRTTTGRYDRYGLTDIQADHWATRLGYHPVQVWGWAWITAATPPDPAEADGEAVA